MKTAIDILYELKYSEDSSLDWSDVIEAMKIYSNQKIEKAAEKVKWNPMLKQSIRDLKDKL